MERDLARRSLDTNALLVQPRWQLATRGSCRCVGGRARAHGPLRGRVTGNARGAESLDRRFFGDSSSATFERARLAAILGERERANDLFLQALDDGFAISQGLGPHNDPDFDSIRGMSAYQLLYRDKN